MSAGRRILVTPQAAAKRQGVGRTPTKGVSTRSDSGDKASNTKRPCRLTRRLTASVATSGTMARRNAANGGYGSCATVQPAAVQRNTVADVPLGDFLNTSCALSETAPTTEGDTS